MGDTILNPEAFPLAARSCILLLARKDDRSASWDESVDESLIFLLRVCCAGESPGSSAKVLMLQVFRIREIVQ